MKSLITGPNFMQYTCVCSRHCWFVHAEILFVWRHCQHSQ